MHGNSHGCLVPRCPSASPVYTLPVAESTAKLNPVRLTSHHYGTQRASQNKPVTRIADSAKQTVETYPNAQIIFHSKKGDVLSAKNLQSIREFQRSITKITKYEKYCLRGDSHGKDCMIPYSPSGIATWTSQTFADDDSSCNCATEFDVPCANCDSDCSADFYLPGCMADPMAPLPTSEWGKTAEPPFNAMCKQGTSDNADTSTCYYMLYQTRLNVMGTNWDCSNLEASWTRILVPFGLPIGNNDDDTEEMEDTIFSWGSNVFLPAFFELKAELEMDNSDLKNPLKRKRRWFGADEFIYELDAAPKGHLPLTSALRGTMLLKELLKHPVWGEEEFKDSGKGKFDK